MACIHDMHAWHACMHAWHACMSCMHDMGLICGSFGDDLGINQGSFGGHLGIIRRSFEHHLGSSGHHLGVIWGSSGTIWGPSGTIGKHWKPLEILWKPLEILRNPQKPLETFGNLRKPSKKGWKNTLLGRNGSNLGPRSSRPGRVNPLDRGTSKIKVLANFWKLNEKTSFSCFRWLLGCFAGVIFCYFSKRNQRKIE